MRRKNSCTNSGLPPVFSWISVARSVVVALRTRNSVPSQRATAFTVSGCGIISMACCADAGRLASCCCSAGSDNEAMSRCATTSNSGMAPQVPSKCFSVCRLAASLHCRSSSSKTSGQPCEAKVLTSASTIWLKRARASMENVSAEKRGLLSSSSPSSGTG